MKITAVTCTYERPQAFALCERYIARQTRAPDQWLVLDGPEPMGTKLLNAIKGGKIEGDGVVVWEDDDYYTPGWIKWCAAYLERYAIVGQGKALYYHVGRRWWSNCGNTRHASLCQTAFRRDLLECVINVIESYDNQFFDTRIWRLDRSKYLHLPQEHERMVIGIKGMPGRLGYSQEHANVTPPGAHADPALFDLWRMIGEDASAYAPFYRK